MPVNAIIIDAFDGVVDPSHAAQGIYVRQTERHDRGTRILPRYRTVDRFQCLEALARPLRKSEPASNQGGLLTGAEQASQIKLY
jgi:hypothetical protein